MLTVILALESSEKLRIVAPPLPMIVPQSAAGTSMRSCVEVPSRASIDSATAFSPFILATTRCSAVRTWLTVPLRSIIRSVVPGKYSLARDSWMRALDWVWKSVMLLPALPMILPAAAFDIRNFAITFCSLGVAAAGSGASSSSTGTSGVSSSGSASSSLVSARAVASCTVGGTLFRGKRCGLPGSRAPSFRPSPPPTHLIVVTFQQMSCLTKAVPGAQLVVGSRQLWLQENDQRR